MVPDSLPVVAVCGEVELDLREALLQSGRIVIYATLILGTIHLIVPDGVAVEMSGTAALTRKVTRTVRRPGPRPQVPGPDGVRAPVIELRTAGFGGTIKVTSPKRPRRLGGLRRSRSVSRAGTVGRACGPRRMPTFAVRLTSSRARAGALAVEVDRAVGAQLPQLVLAVDVADGSRPGAHHQRMSGGAAGRYRTPATSSPSVMPVAAKNASSEVTRSSVVSTRLRS